MRVYTSETAAKTLGISRRQLLGRLRTMGVLPVSMGSRRVVLVSDVQIKKIREMREARKTIDRDAVPKL